MRNQIRQKGSAFADILLIVLICLSTVCAIGQTVRVNSRRAQQQRIKAVRRPVTREVRL